MMWTKHLEIQINQNTREDKHGGYLCYLMMSLYRFTNFHIKGIPDLKA